MTTTPTKLAIASDHGGLELKTHLINFLKESLSLEIQDLGTHTTDSVDYPDFAQKAVESILSGDAKKAILICGTGIGISIKANRTKGIRAALVHDQFTAEMAAAHNNANILCLGGRTTSPDLAETLVKTWLKTPYESGRHENRLKKLDN